MVKKELIMDGMDEKMLVNIKTYKKGYLPHGHIDTNLCNINLDVTRVPLSSCPLANATAMPIEKVLESSRFLRSLCLLNNNIEEERLCGCNLPLTNRFAA